MLFYLILGVAMVAGFVLAGRWFVAADPKTLVKALKWTLLGLIGSAVLFFLFERRFDWALFTLPALIPWFVRARTAHRLFKTFSRMSQAAGGGAAGGGRTSDVETRFLRMSLDHDTGDMTGEVREGAFAGRRVETLALAELVDLLRTCWVEDRQSAQVLEAYLDRAHPDWREQAKDASGAAGANTGAGADGGRAAPRGASMTRAEALDVLGLADGAAAADIKEAHRRLIAGLHPDHGGSTYLAAKINQARDVLLGD